MTRLAVAAIILAFAGCTSWSVFERPSGTLLVKADRLLDQGEYARAVAAYDELLVRYPDDAAAPRARSSRDAVARLIAAREEVERLRQALSARERDLSRRSRRGSATFSRRGRRWPCATARCSAIDRSCSA